MAGEQFMSRCWGVDSHFALSFTDDERREIEAIAGPDLAPRVFEELRALAFHAQSRRSLTSENDDIVGVRKKHADIAKAARRLFEELTDDEFCYVDYAPAFLGFGSAIVEDEVAGEVQIFDEVLANSDFEAFVKVLKHIENQSSYWSTSYGLTVYGHNASDKLKEYVVDGVIEIFCELMEREIPPSGGNPNGPAARFLFSAANPILRPIERGLSSLYAARQQLARRRDVNKRG